MLPVHWTAPPTTTAELTSLGDTVASFWSAQSAGALTTTVRVRDSVAVTDPGTCDPGTLASVALAAHGVKAAADPRTHVVFTFPRRADCGWDSTSTAGGSEIWVNGASGASTWAHEFGHNLGLGHASQLACTGPDGPVPFSDDCTVLDGKDRPDVMSGPLERWMGEPAFDLNAALTYGFGWGEVVDASATSVTTVDLAEWPRGEGTRAVRLPMAAGGDFFVQDRTFVGIGPYPDLHDDVEVVRRVLVDGVPTSQRILPLAGGRPSRPSWRTGRGRSTPTPCSVCRAGR
ncbi:hypothetical protein [Cellulomonas aerilata]|uniref:Peptidase M11 gametolysin domain-containing protein n=1 Tax=Cellulomonas aerilata TaxID=515326 RepID=A0A512DA36_9CELL|nr:hypothetical protein [Cellulomonas aerilata]GEO33315.1 hypothetical protein CAE01nite_10400 [Cellulomonas aerilata]